jgi:hypothetical protein
MFRQLVFYVGEDTPLALREFIQAQQGRVLPLAAVPKTRESACHYKLVASATCDFREASLTTPTTCPVVLDSWVVQCFLHQRKVEVAPFCVSFPLGWTQYVALMIEGTPELAIAQPEGAVKGKGKAKPYSVEEDELLKKCAREHDGKGWTQEQLWTQVENRKTLPGRTASSMQQRYAVLARSVFRMSRRHYTRQDELGLYAWAWAWRNKRYSGAETGIWAAAEANHVVMGRTKGEMKRKYHRCVRKESGGKKAALAIGEANVQSQVWRDVFTGEGAQLSSSSSDGDDGDSDD